MRLLFCASGRFPNDQRWECDMGLHIEIRSFNLLQNIFSSLRPHIVDVDVHDREHSWEGHLKGHRQTETKKRWKPFASISFENTFMLFLLLIYLFLLILPWVQTFFSVHTTGHLQYIRKNKHHR